MTYNQMVEKHNIIINGLHHELMASKKTIDKMRQRPDLFTPEDIQERTNRHLAALDEYMETIKALRDTESQQPDSNDNDDNDQ